MRHKWLHRLLHLRLGRRRGHHHRQIHREWKKERVAVGIAARGKDRGSLGGIAPTASHGIAVGKGAVLRKESPTAFAAAWTQSISRIGAMSCATIEPSRTCQSTLDDPKQYAGPFKVDSCAQDHVACREEVDRAVG